VARAEWLNDDAAARRDHSHLALIAKSFMRPAAPTGTISSRATANAIAPVTPARVLYHLFLGVAEVDRLFAQTSS